MLNEISDIKYKDKKNTYIYSEIDKFLEKYKDKNISISYDKNKFDTEKITDSLIKLHNNVFDFDQFTEEYNKFMDNGKGFEGYKDEKEPGSVSSKQTKKKDMQKI